MRKEFLPFAKPCIGEDAIADVADSMRSGWLAMGPKTISFEKNFAGYVGCAHALSVNSATAGLHLALLAFGVGEGDEVITTPMTFAATANAIMFTGARPVFADIDRRTLNISPEKIEAAITPATKAIIPVHFAGMPCDMDRIEDIAERHGLYVIEDAAHALGAEYRGRKIGGGGRGRAAVFSFHPTKNITTGEGGMICTEDGEAAEIISALRQNGMSKNSWNRYAAGGRAHYDIFRPGLKYTMMDIQGAIGSSQLKSLDFFNARRRAICARYDRELAASGLILPAAASWEHVHARHIYTPLVDGAALGFSRDEFMAKMKERNVGTALHYQALHLYSCFGGAAGISAGDMPEAEYVSDRIVSIPLFPSMTDDDVTDVIEAVYGVCGGKRGVRL